MKPTAKIKNRFLLLLSSFVLISVLVFVGIQKGKDYSQITPQEYSIGNSDKRPRNYKSEKLRFTIGVPNDYVLEEKLTVVSLDNDGKKITISRNGTNFNNLESYIKSLEKLNNITIGDLNFIKINDLNAAIGSIRDDRIYFFYTDSQVFSLSANDKEIFSDLDQIAQSFRYTP